MAMNDHYYVKQPKTASQPRTWETQLRAANYRFMSDEGVFSKRGVDFGSRLLIETFQFPEETDWILDLGCGYGVIGLALAGEQPARDILMVDINQRAVHLAAKNARMNRITNTTIMQSHLFENVSGPGFAAIVSNPPVRAGKSLLYQLFHNAYEHLLVDGMFWIVIRKQQGAASAMNKLDEIFDAISVRKKKKGYIVICAIKKV